LLEGATRVRVNGHERRVRCRIERVEGVSGHGDREDLLRWFAGFPQRPARVVLNHGIAGARSEFSAALATGGTAVHTPMLGEPISF
jgi:metallo-beta-lactamase family protein